MGAALSLWPKRGHRHRHRLGSAQVSLGRGSGSQGSPGEHRSPRHSWEVEH